MYNTFQPILLLTHHLDKRNQFSERSFSFREIQMFGIPAQTQSHATLVVKEEPGNGETVVHSRQHFLELETFGVLSGGCCGQPVEALPSNQREEGFCISFTFGESAGVVV
ncbi:hypothetical protein AC579_9170 [Pseudocercospora musae]|uniref:Uncharacterized protein n=1 Tax=Pseudocercospora musae TaxID=113226 RepID=A0A139I756_9PEZI|nr:hypothetical protein AC579_9170 [Pseudocercospora musae]